MDHRKTVLVVDVKEKIVEVVKSYLMNHGYIVHGAHSGGEALEI